MTEPMIFATPLPPRQFAAMPVFLHAASPDVTRCYIIADVFADIYVIDMRRRSSAKRAEARSLFDSDFDGCCLITREFTCRDAARGKAVRQPREEVSAPVRAMPASVAARKMRAMIQALFAQERAMPLRLMICAACYYFAKSAFVIC